MLRISAYFSGRTFKLACHLEELLPVRILGIVRFVDGNVLLAQLEEDRARHVGHGFAAR